MIWRTHSFTWKGMFERRAAFANIAPVVGQLQSPGAFDAAILEDRILFGAVPLPGAAVGNDSGAGFTSMRAWRRFDPVMILEEAESRSRDVHSGLTRESSESRAHMIVISTGETSPPPAGETSK